MPWPFMLWTPVDWVPIENISRMLFASPLPMQVCESSTRQLISRIFIHDA